MAEVLVAGPGTRYLDEAGAFWRAVGYDPIAAPPSTPPPEPTLFLLSDAGSTLNGTKVLN
jgi:hypothetical protein